MSVGRTLSAGSGKRYKRVKWSLQMCWRNVICYSLFCKGGRIRLHISWNFASESCIWSILVLTRVYVVNVNVNVLNSKWSEKRLWNVEMFALMEIIAHENNLKVRSIIYYQSYMYYNFVIFSHIAHSYWHVLLVLLLQCIYFSLAHLHMMYRTQLFILIPDNLSKIDSN